MSLTRIAALAVIVLVAATFPSDTSLAAKFAPTFQEHLDGLGDNQVTAALIILHAQPDLKNLEQRLGVSETTRYARHKLILTQLQDFASKKQAAIKLLLESGLDDGEVRSFETFWLTNVIEVVATKRFIISLAERQDIKLIAPDLPPPSIPTPAPDAEIGAIRDGNGVGIGLQVIAAESVWALGYNGTGRLIATLDTGVDGFHPALSSSYRGNHGYPAKECWFDPIYQEDYPHYEPSATVAYAHGTNTMGILVGKDDLTGDTTGVAWGAQWISAMVVDIPGSSYLQALQWAADPDGDPNTLHDVPDVLSNSWGYREENLGCEEVFWNAIDNLEALGVIAFFAAGNEGASGLRNPANRASTPYNCFSVGAIDPYDPSFSIWAQSSRGPSDCDGVSIKPEVTAPGYQVPTAHVDGGYVSSTGTSFSTPHVAGAAALLRQYNPNATADQVKHALMYSALDLGDPGEDNTYGMGLIDLPAALALMPTTTAPNVYVDSLGYGELTPGASVEAVVLLRNAGLGVLDVVGQLHCADQRVTILNGVATFGDLPKNGAVDNQDYPFVLSFGQDILEGTVISVDLWLAADAGSYQDTLQLYFTVGTPVARQTYTHVTDSCQFTISNYGTYGLASNSAVPAGGHGFQYPAGGSNSLYQCGLLLGVDSNHVSDGIANLLFSVDEDFAVSPGGNIEVLTSKYGMNAFTTSGFDDAAAQRPIGLAVKQRTRSYAADSLANLVILEYQIGNRTAVPLEGIFVGLYFDWDFPYGLGSRDRTGYAADYSLGYMWDESGADYRGTAVLGAAGPSGFLAIDNSELIYDGISEPEKYSFLTADFSNTEIPFSTDQSYCIASGPLSLAPSQIDTVAFVVVAAANLGRLQQLAESANAIYGISICGDANGDAIVNITDAVYLIQYIFSGGSEPDPYEAGDVNCDGIVNITDAVYLISYIFSGGYPPCDTDGDGIPDC
ncbi:MAG: S8 family serine peptidase [bacterium]